MSAEKRIDDDAAVERELDSHGMVWNDIHEGFFGNREYARRFLDAVGEAARRSKPDVIVDLGGGTGFLLGELIDSGRTPMVKRHVDLDLSGKQLAQIERADVETFEASLATFNRRDFAADGESCLYMTRSTFHYFGIFGLNPTIAHIRRQTRPGEWFVHQTIAYHHPVDSLCVSELYELLNTDKWMPSVAAARRAMTANGFAIEKVEITVPLRLRSDDLGKRYQIDAERMRGIGRRLRGDFGEKEGLLEFDGDDFVALGDYFVFSCVAE